MNQPIANPNPSKKPDPRKLGLPMGIARGEPLVPPDDLWWQPLPDDELKLWLAGDVEEPESR